MSILGMRPAELSLRVFGITYAVVMAAGMWMAAGMCYRTPEEKPIVKIEHRVQENGVIVDRAINECWRVTKYKLVDDDIPGYCYDYFTEKEGCSDEEPTQQGWEQLVHRLEGFYF